ncbi:MULTISPECIES: hypothetical protein [Pseudomonas]|uniref:hypothetical protein n=1 Tax=Pseudomonas TaxID=286 RepID=UPI000379C564|nr:MULTISPECIES: hypothetical protein [Pseudomonas]UUT22851.1 hypothetical protein NRG23_02470 [Pseudomonas sp. T8]
MNKHTLFSLAAVIKCVQRAVINAAARQDMEPAALYPEGMSARTAGFELPFPQCSTPGTHAAKAGALPWATTSG